jgi:hypothetical protein
MPHVAVNVGAERAFHVASETETCRFWRTRVGGTAKGSPTRLKFAHRTRGAIRMTVGVTFPAVHQEICPGRENTPAREHIHRWLGVGISTGDSIRLVVYLFSHPSSLDTITDMIHQTLRNELLLIHVGIL